MRRRLPFLRLVLGLFLALVLAAACGLLLVRTERIVVARGTLRGGSVAITAPRDGLVAEVLVEDGAPVRPGQALVRLDTTGIADRVARARERLSGLRDRTGRLRQRIERLVHDVFPAERRRASCAVDEKRVALREAEARARALARLGQEGLASELEVEAARLDRDRARIALEEARRELDLLPHRQRQRADTLRGELASLAAEIADQEALLAALREQLRRSLVTSPAAGTVSAPGLRDLPGRHVNSGDELLRLVTGGTREFLGIVPDEGRAHVRPGQVARIRLDAWPWMIHGVLPGRVLTVGEVRRGSGGFPVRIAIDTGRAPGPLCDGMAGEARIVVRERVSLGRLLLEHLSGTTEP